MSDRFFITVEADGFEGHFEGRFEAHPVPVNVGTAPNSEIMLPRDDFIDFGRRDFCIFFERDGVRFEHYGAPQWCCVDGEQTRDCVLSWGLHVLVIADKPLRLSVQRAAAGTGMVKATEDPC